MSRVLAACRALGFCQAGVVPVERVSRAGAFEEWLEAGMNGSMSWLAEQVDLRIDPTRYMPGARSILIVADRYAAAGHGQRRPGRGLVARYARGADYHRRIKRRLRMLADRLCEESPGAECLCFADSSPVMEREHAARAGLGFIGKHTLLIDPSRGSWLLLGGILTTIDVDPDRRSAVRDAAGAGGCGTCTRCIDSCPTSAITQYRVDARLCISYLTIEHEGAIDPVLHEGIGEWMIGCDVCQEVCPYSQGVGGGRHRGDADPVYIGSKEHAEGFDPLGVLSWSEAERAERISGTAGKRVTLPMLQRNAAIVATNLALRGEIDRGSLENKLRDIADDGNGDAGLRHAASEGLKRLGPGA